MRTMVAVTLGLVIVLNFQFRIELLDYKKANEVIQHDEELTNILAQQIEYEKKIAQGGV